MVISRNKPRGGSTQAALERVSPHLPGYLGNVERTLTVTWKGTARMTMGGLVPPPLFLTVGAPSGSPRVVVDFFRGASSGLQKSFDRWRTGPGIAQKYLGFACTTTPFAPRAMPIPPTTLCSVALPFVGEHLLADVRAAAPRAGIEPQDWDSTTRVIAAQVGANWAARLNSMMITGASLAANRKSFTAGRLA